MKTLNLLLLGAIAALFTVALFSQQAPAPLTDKEKLQAAESFILLQDSQQKMLASPTWQIFQQRQREYGTLLQGFQRAKGAAKCTLTIKQEWSCPPPAITQSTKGPNSPVIAGVKGDVNIEIGDERKEPDVSDPTPAPK